MCNYTSNVGEFITKELCTSPVFNLSMASKELFHSNLLFWLSNNYKTCFLNIAKQLGIEINNRTDKWKSYREKNNIDLSIYEETNDTVLFILENKVKSIPHMEQLEKYTKNYSCLKKNQKMLLTLTANFPNKSDIEKSWTIKNYDELANAIKDNLWSISDCYHQMLLNDYCKTIKLLHQIQSCWKFDLNDNYIKTFVDEKVEDTIRIGDLRKKVMYSQLAIKIQEEIKGKIKTNKEILDISIEHSDTSDNRFVNWGMTRSMGIVDIKLKVVGNLILGIQLQGPSYKHYLESLDKKDKNIIDHVRSCDKNSICINNVKGQTLIDNIIETKFLQFNKRELEGYPFSQESADIPKYREIINKYGDSFIYQYVNIKGETSIKEIIEAIKKDIQTIQKIVKNVKIINT